MNEARIAASRTPEASSRRPARSRHSSRVATLPRSVHPLRTRSNAARSSSEPATSTRRRYAYSALASSATFSAQYRRNVW